MKNTSIFALLLSITTGLVFSHSYANVNCFKKPLDEATRKICSGIIEELTKKAEAKPKKIVKKRPSYRFIQAPGKGEEDCVIDTRETLI